MWEVQKNRVVFGVLVVLLFVILIVAIALGAVVILPSQMFSGIEHLLTGKPPTSLYEGVFVQLRLPRVILCAITGAILAVSGVLMQGLFRNPIVEPGLIGTSSGAAFGASIVFVLSAAISPALKASIGPWLVPVFAFVGGLISTFVVYALSKDARGMPVLSLLLVGMAVNAVGMSGTGFMSYLARDPQARSITFWNLGTFSGASWMQVLITGIVAIVVFYFSFRYSKELNALLLGENEAELLGIQADKLKRNILILNTAMVSIATAFVGVINFVGLIVPHTLRLVIGSDNRMLLPAAALAGAILLTLADLGARLMLAPAEIPIGILTSLVGAPIFIFLLKRFHLFSTKNGEDA
jgi:iron complex transport system permease protein